MKQAQNARQQRGRPSSRQGGKSNRGPGNHRNEQKSRGNPKQLVDKYQNQARECLQAGDRMQAEYYFQFAEHYYRVLNENRSNNASQGDRDGQQNNNRRPHSQNGDQSENDASQSGRHNRRGRRGRPHDDRQNNQGGEAEIAAEKSNGAASDNGSTSIDAGDAPQPDIKPLGKPEKSSDKLVDKAAKVKASSVQAVPKEPVQDMQQNNSQPPEKNGDVAKPVKRRAPRKSAVSDEKPTPDAVLNPVASDLS